MRRSWTAAAAALGCLLIAGTVAAASDEAGATDPLAVREEAVALVLAQDPRFADVPDYEQQRILMASSFSFMPVLGSSYYRTLPTLSSLLAELQPGVFQYPGSWLIEVTLVRGCVEPSGDTGISVDPCDWRHSWYYRVQPDRTVTLLFDEGDASPMPSGVE